MHRDAVANTTAELTDINRADVALAKWTRYHKSHCMDSIGRMNEAVYYETTPDNFQVKSFKYSGNEGVSGNMSRFSSRRVVTSAFAGYVGNVETKFSSVADFLVGASELSTTPPAIDQEAASWDNRMIGVETGVIGYSCGLLRRMARNRKNSSACDLLHAHKEVHFDETRDDIPDEVAQ